MKIFFTIPRFHLSTSAFCHRDYRYYFAGQLISNIGNWVQSVAQSWLIYRLTGSAELLGTTAFVQQIPFFVLGPIAGSVADRFDRRRTLLVTHWSALAVAVLLAVLTLLGEISPWQIIVLAGLAGVINAFDIPTRQAFVREIVGLDDLANAVALNSSMLTGARLIGPAIGGIMVANLGEGWCFCLNGLSFLGVVVCLLVIRPSPRSNSTANLSMIETAIEGMLFVRSAAPIRTLMLLGAFVGLFAMPYNSLLPIFANQIFDRGPEALGTLMSAVGIGAFIGALLLANRRGLKGLGQWIAWSVIGFGLSLLLFSFSPLFWLSAGLLLVAGLCHMVQMTAALTLVQSMVPDHMRGRVLALYSMIQQGVPPFGSLAAGFLATRFGAPATVAAGSLACVAAGLVFHANHVRFRQQGRTLVQANRSAPEAKASHKS